MCDFRRCPLGNHPSSTSTGRGVRTTPSTVGYRKIQRGTTSSLFVYFLSKPPPRNDSFLRSGCNILRYLLFFNVVPPYRLHVSRNFFYHLKHTVPSRPRSGPLLSITNTATPLKARVFNFKLCPLKEAWIGRPLGAALPCLGRHRRR